MIWCRLRILTTWKQNDYFSVWLPSINSVTEGLRLIDNLQVANMPGHSIKQRAQRKNAVELAQRNKWSYSFLAFSNLQKCPHGDKYCVLIQLQVLTPQGQVIQNCTWVQLEYKYKYQVLHNDCDSNKLFVASTALNFWVKNSVMSIQDSLTRQQFSMIMDSLLQSLRIACSFTVFSSVRISVLICLLFPFNGCLSVIDR